MKAHGIWTAPHPETGRRTFTPEPVEIHLGSRVRVMGTGYGATLALCGQEGTVVGLGRTRALVAFRGETRTIGAACLAVLS